MNQNIDKEKKSSFGKKVKEYTIRKQGNFDLLLHPYGATETHRHTHRQIPASSRNWNHNPSIRATVTVKASDGAATMLVCIVIKT